MQQEMQFRQLGRSGLLVSSLCLGTMIFGEESGRGCDEAQSRRLIARFLEAGGNFIDTADAYAKGASEEIVGRAISDRRNDIVLSSKVGLPTGEGVNDAGLGRQHILAGVEASLKRLNTDYLDILFFHTHDPLTPIEESLEAAATLIQAGKVRYLGVCNQFAWRLAEACTSSRYRGLPKIICAQYQYSPVCRTIEHEYVDLFHAFGVSLIPWSPLAGGLLSGKYGDRKTGFRFDAAPSLEDNRDRRLSSGTSAIMAVISEVAVAHGKSPSQITLAWSLSKSFVGSIAIGARTLEQLDDNLGAPDVVLSDEDVRKIDAASAPSAIYPYDFMRKARPGRRSDFVQSYARGAS